MNIRRVALPVIAAAAAVVLAACSGSSGKGAGSRSTTTRAAASSTTTTSPGAAPTDASAGVVTAVAVAEIPRLGKVLVGANGNTLYTYSGDNGPTSGCTGECAKTWPLVGANGSPRGGAGVSADKLTTAGGHLLYFGHLVHTYSGDEFPGDVKGLQVSGWKAISPAGAGVS